jgi:hypothetical protein
MSFPQGLSGTFMEFTTTRSRDRCIVLTGDAGSECRIMRTEDGFASVETVGEGDETWRAVSVLFDENKLPLRNGR